MSLVNSDIINNSFQTSTEVATRWLQWQCKMIAGIKVGRVYVYQEETQKFQTLASWPENLSKDEDPVLSDLANKTLNSKDILNTKVNYSLSTQPNVYDATGLPLRYGDKVIGVVVFLQNVYSQEHKKAVFPLLQWGCTWLESSLISEYEEKSQLTHLITQLTGLALTQDTLEFSAHQICNLLSQELNCESVSFAILEGLQMHTIALSKQLRFDHRSEHIRQIESAMEEALDQEESIIFPLPHDQKHLISAKHQMLSSSSQDMAIYTLVLSDTQESFASITLMRKKSQNFSKEENFILKKSAKLLGPAIALKLKNEHSFFQQFKQKFQHTSASIFGKEYLKLKLALVSILFLLISLSLIKTSSYVYADSTLEGELQQVIMAFDDGHIKSSFVRAGDTVNKGQDLLHLQDRDLQLELEILFTEKDKLDKEYQEELALGERAKISILSAQIDQANAKITLTQQKIQHTKFTSPFAGIIVSGDLSQDIGKPVKKGEQLFEVALLDDYRVILDVNEYDVAKLQLTHKGELRLIGLPYETFPVTITRITPIASVKDGGNYFHVEADLNEKDDTRLKPGMQGVVKIKVEEASVLWVWTHSLLDRLRLWFWSIGL